MQIQGATALVAGGASGLGAATARRLAEAGANVTIADLNEEKGEALAGELGATFVRCDVTEPDQVEAAVPEGVRISVCCAGVGWAEKVAGKRGAHQFEPFRITVTINLIGTFNVMRLAAAAMLANEPDDGGECGVIVNTASIAAYDGQIGQIAYAASKGGVVGMTLPAARDLASARVRVCTIAPVCSTPRCWPGCPTTRARRSATRSPTRTASARPRSTARWPPNRREPDAQRRGHPARRRAAHAAALISVGVPRSRSRTSTAGIEVGRVHPGPAEYVVEQHEVVEVTYVAAVAVRADPYPAAVDVRWRGRARGIESHSTKMLLARATTQRYTAHRS